MLLWVWDLVILHFFTITHDWRRGILGWHILSYLAMVKNPSMHSRVQIQILFGIFFEGDRATGITLLVWKNQVNRSNSFWITVVPALGDPRRERPPAVCGHFVNVPTHFKVKLPVISGNLPNADADSHLLVVSTCYNGQCKQMPRFRWSFQPKIAGAHPNLRPTDLSNFRAVVWWLWQCVYSLGISLVVIVLCSIARCIIFGVTRLPVRPCDERPPAMYGHFCRVPRVSVHDRYYCNK